MNATRARAIAEGEIAPGDLDAGEHAIATLVHKSAVAPTKLTTDDLRDVKEAYGVRGAIELTTYLASFHFINRIADLVGIQSDLPVVQPRFRRLRRLGVRLQGWSMGKMLDLSRQDADVDVDEVFARAERVLGPLPAGAALVRQFPNVVGYLGTIAAVVEQLPGELLERVTTGVATALPNDESEAIGFHPRPTDPFDALVFVGTRYASRTTPGLIDAVREKYGYSDAELTDLFYAIAFRNGFERMSRLLGTALL